LDKKVHAEVIGPNPPCSGCTAVLRNAEKAASKLKAEGFEVEVKKLDIMAEDTISKYAKYSVLMSPVLALNGTVKVMGRIPNATEVERLIRDAAE